MPISLRPIDQSNWEECVDLTVGPTQLGFIGTNVRSLAELSVRPDGSAFGIYQDNEMVGFAMLVKDAESGDYDIHRYMIDFSHQAKGIGKVGLGLVVDHVRNLQDRTNKLSIMFLVENTSAETLYRKVGFQDSGKVVKNEKWRFTEKLFYYYFD